MTLTKTKLIYFPLFVLTFFSSCNNNDYNDTSKRNENYIWFEPENGEAHWQKIGPSTISKPETGSITAFYSNSNIYQKSKIEDDIFYDSTHYFDINGEYSYSRIYQEDSSYFSVPDGLLVIHLQNGTLIDSAEYKKNKQHGLTKWFFETGEPRSIINFNNGERHGYAEWYFQKGSIYETANYKDGKLHGHRAYYYENKLLKESFNYDEGELHGKRHWYNDVGEVLDSSEYYHGEKL
jgi:antitoxin component YwqK of YwqJK toxin-antitoxin module